ncbi:hypothetical protein ACS0TY_007841 [Phlomoides rotata]
MDEKNQDSIGYEFKGKIMISSVVILFVACFIIVLFHVYNRWFRHRHHHHHLTTTSAVIVSASQGLDIRAVNSLPTFVYESKNDESPPPECAVCLSEFEDNEAGRILPECGHCFHIGCIDMWLLSHCDCPLCRTRVKVEHVKTPELGVAHVAINVSGYGVSGLNPGEIDMGSSSSSSQSPETIPGGPQDPAKNDGAPDPDRNNGPDIESGSNTPATSVWVLKRLFI